MPPDRARESRPVQTAAPSTVVVGVVLASIALSTQFLFQPFVWRNWPLDEVLAGWLGIAVDQLVLIAPIGLGLVAMGRIRVSDERLRIALVAATVVAGAVAGQVLALVRGGLAYDAGDLLARSVQLALVAASVAGMTAIWRGGAAADALAQASRADAATRRAAADATELEALHRQIEPHFLFNTLATVRQLQLADGDAGRQLLACLLDYLRRSLAIAGASLAPLGDELALVEAYLAICRSRMADRLVSTVDVPAELHAIALPPLVLMTLVENAIRHGLAPAMAGGRITITARRHGMMLDLAIVDDGVGLGELGSGSGIGLANSARRLRLAYGDRATLSLQPHRPRGACARLRVPIAAWR